MRQRIALNEDWKQRRGIQAQKEGEDERYKERESGANRKRLSANAPPLGFRGSLDCPTCIKTVTYFYGYYFLCCIVIGFVLYIASYTSDRKLHKKRIALNLLYVYPIEVV